MTRESNEERAPLPPGWEWASLSEFLAQRSTSLIPTAMPEEKFILYSVPSFDSGTPETAYGRDIGSTKQVVACGSVLLCKINPRINRAWVVGEPSKNHKVIASTEWIVFPPNRALAARLPLPFLINDERKELLGKPCVGRRRLIDACSAVNRWNHPDAPGTSFGAAEDCEPD